MKPNKQNCPFEENITDLRHTQEKLKDAAENSEDVRNGVSTPEEEKKEPGYVIYNEIMETTVKILQSDTMASVFATMAEKIGEDMTKSFITALSLAMTHSSYNAIVLYDHMIKSELQKSFDTIGEGVNNLSGIVNGHHGAMSVMKSRIEALEKAVGINPKAAPNKQNHSV